MPSSISVSGAGSGGRPAQNAASDERRLDLAPPVPKVITYITQRGRLLVFRQMDFPEQGIQVPGGTVEAGEMLAVAALREASEETGLRGLTVERYLGCAEYHLKVDTGAPHLRHYFHLECSEDTPPRWQHLGSFPVSAPPVRFELWWEPLGSARLDWEMDAYLEGIGGTTHR